MFVSSGQYKRLSQAWFYVRAILLRVLCERLGCRVIRSIKVCLKYDTAPI